MERRQKTSKNPPRFRISGRGKCPKMSSCQEVIFKLFKSRRKNKNFSLGIYGPKLGHWNRLVRVSCRSNVRLSLISASSFSEDDSFEDPFSSGWFSNWCSELTTWSAYWDVIGWANHPISINLKTYVRICSFKISSRFTKNNQSAISQWKDTRPTKSICLRK